LILEDLGDEVLIYDPEIDRAHCLNRSAAMVWRLCDGQRSVADISATMSHQLGTTVDETLVYAAVHELDREYLLGEFGAQPESPVNTSRRAVLKTIGWLAAIGLTAPVVTSLFAPTPAQAQSGPCTPVDHPCGIDAPTAPPCCPGTACTDCGKGRGFFVCKSTC